MGTGMKAVCIVSPQYLPHIGGVEQYVDNFSRELLKLGHSVTIVTSSIESMPKYEKKGKLEIYRLPSLQFMGGRFPVLKFGKTLKKFKIKFKEKHFDIMLVNTRFYLLSLYAVRLAKKLNLRCAILDHGTSHLNAGGKILSKFGEWYEHAITFIEKRYCDEFAGVSGAALEWLKHFKIHSNLILYNAIDVDSFLKLKKDNVRDFRAEFGIPKNHIIVSFVGRLTCEKGIMELVHAVNRICRERRDVWLLAAGDGYLRSDLEKIKNGNIRLLGQISREEVALLLRESEIFCLPSVSEGFPTCVLEAVACENYVITTFRGGAKEMISDSRYGMILPNNNKETLYKAIKKVLGQKNYRDRAVKLCYDRLLEHYTWEQTVKTFLTLFD